MRIGVLASHEGTTLQAVLDACANGAIAGRVVVVISNNRESGALARARAVAVPACHLSARTHPDEVALDSVIRDTLAQHDVDVVLLAGYMKKIGPQTLARFPGSIINTHPALLPRFGGPGMYGAAVHRAVLASGERVTGASIHVVDATYDTGPVIARRQVPVEPGDTVDTLAARVQACERALLVETLGRIADGSIRLPVD